LLIKIHAIDSVGQPTDSQAIPVHEIGTALSFAGSDSKLCLENGQGLAVIPPGGA
jgi:hypothetical protein